MDAIKKFFASFSSSKSPSSAISSSPSSSSAAISSSFEEHVSEDCGSQFVGTLVCVGVGLRGWIPTAMKTTRTAVDQGKLMLLSPFLATHTPSPCIASARGDASGGVQTGFLCPTLIRDRQLIGCEQIILIQEASKSIVFKKLHATSQFYPGSSSSSSSSSSADSSYLHLRLQDVCSVLVRTCLLVLEAMIMKPIQQEGTNEHEELPTTAADCQEKGSPVSFLRKGHASQMISLYESKPSNIVFEKAARVDASVIVQSGFPQPTLTGDGKLIGCENRQGKDKQLTSVMERTRKLHKVDLIGKHEINDVNIHRIVPKGGNPIESQKHKGQKKQLNSVMERRTITGLVTKQHKQVVGTQRTIRGAVPAQGHIPVVRSGFKRPTLIQKDSRSIGSEKLLVSKKLQSSIAQSKKKPGIIDSSRKNHINVASTRKGFVDERYLQSISNKNSENIDPSRKNKMRVVSTRKELVDERLLHSVSKKKQGNIDPSRENDIKVVGTRKDFVDGRYLESVSKQKNVKVVPQVPPCKGCKISSISELKPQWKI